MHLHYNARGWPAVVTLILVILGIWKFIDIIIWYATFKG